MYKNGMAQYIPRTIEATVLSMAESFPVVTIMGPRQSGKTTLVRKLFPNHAYANLEQPDVRLLAELDPQAFLMRFAFPVIMDEIQRVPALLSYIQVIVDENRSYWKHHSSCSVCPRISRISGSASSSHRRYSLPNRALPHGFWASGRQARPGMARISAGCSKTWLWWKP